MRAANSVRVYRKIRENENGIFIADDICRKCSVYWLFVLDKAIWEINDSMYEI